MKKENPSNNLSATEVVHKVNNMLSTINLSADVLLQEVYGSATPEQKKYLKKIMEEVRNIEVLIRTLK